MAQKKYKPESFGNSGKIVAREDAGTLGLPEFDSLPATAGLSNIEAFRLSVRHALSLLPAMLSKNMNAQEWDYPERFSL